MSKDTYITLAIHTYDVALKVKEQLELCGINVKLQNVNLKSPTLSSGIRVRISEKDLPYALRIVENNESVEKLQEIINSQQILIPVDFTENSLAACKVGFEIAQKLSLHPVILNTFVSPYFKGSLPISDNLSPEIKDIEIQKKLEKQSNTQMKLFTARINQLIAEDIMPKLKFSTIVKEGVPEEIILDYSKNHNPAMIVMATRGQNQKQEDMIGSVTAEVLDSCRVPVFTVPEGCKIDKFIEIDRIAFLCNLDHNDIISMDSFLRIFKREFLQIDIVPVNERAGTKIYERVKRLVKYFESHYNNINFSSVILAHRSFRNDIETLIENHKIKLLVVPNKKKNIFARLFNPSIAHKMLFERDIPMLVLPI